MHKIKYSNPYKTDLMPPTTVATSWHAQFWTAPPEIDQGVGIHHKSNLIYSYIATP